MTDETDDDGPPTELHLRISDGPGALDERDVGGLTLREVQILAAVERRTAGGGRSVWTAVIVSAGAFALFSLAGGNVADWWVLVPILLLHEAGHFAAMRAFGYRNVRMFILPVGGAVSGRALNVAGWKRAVVALAGPVPSLFLLTFAGVWGAWSGVGWLTLLGVAGLALNLFNLLPVWPLDGGWVLQYTLFCRHKTAEVASRAVALLALAGLGYAFGSWILAGFAGLGALGLPVAYRQAGLAARLRAAGFAARSPDGRTIPASSALRLVRAVEGANPGPAPPATVATQVAELFEALNTRRPGALATLGLLAAYAAAAVLGVAGLIGTVAVAGGLPAWPGGGFVGAAGPVEPLPPGEVAAVGPAFDADPPPGSATVAVRAGSPADAAALAARLAAATPGTRAVLVGPTLLLTPPAGDEAVADDWLAEFDAAGLPVLAGDPKFDTFTLTAAAPGPAAVAAVEAGLDRFTAVPRELRPLAPWDRRWREAPADERAMWEANRATLVRMVAVARDAPTPNAADLADRVRAAREARERGEPRVEFNLERELTAASRRESAAACEAYVAGLDGPERAVAGAFVPLVALQRFASTDGERAAALAETVAVRPLLGCEPGPPFGLGKGGGAATWVSLFNEEWFEDLGLDPSRLNVAVGPARTGAGLPELVRWLTDRGFTDLRYDGWASRTGGRPF